MDRRTIDTLTYLPITRELAWRRYLLAVRAADPDSYAQVEEEAWAELEEMLARIAPDPVPAA